MSTALVNDPALIKLPSQRELLTAVFRGWKLVIFCALVGLIVAINGLHSAPYLYTVQMTVTPAQRSANTGAAGGLASLVSLAMPSGQPGSDFDLYLDLIKSRNLADELAKDDLPLMRTLYGGDWDEATQSWREHAAPPSSRFSMNSLWDFLGYPSAPWHAPDGENLLAFISNNVEIQQDPRKPYMAKLAMNYGDRAFAIQFLAKLHHAADEMLRKRAIQRTTEYISYLSNTLSKVTVAEHRFALAQALSEQEKAAMIARSGSAFAAEVLEEPWANSYPSSPQPFQTLARSTFIGALVGGLLALLHWAVMNRLRQRSARRRGKLAVRTDG